MGIALQQRSWQAIVVVWKVYAVFLKVCEVLWNVCLRQHIPHSALIANGTRYHIYYSTIHLYLSVYIRFTRDDMEVIIS